MPADFDIGYGFEVELDALDRQLIHALRLDGRLGFSRIGAVLGVSDQTVARRYRRLCENGVLRVVARPDPVLLGHDMWLLRLRCTPDAAGAVAEGLARRPDTSWISLSSGGTEITCLASGPDPGGREALLLRKLPRTPRITAISAHLVLHMYTGGPLDTFVRPDALSAGQVARLRPDPPAPDPAAAELTGADEALLAALARDGRAGYPRLARETGWSESTVRRRLEQLRRSGAMYFDVEVDSVALGYPVRVNLWLSVAPAHLAAAGEALSRQPEVVFAAATTGPSNLVATVICADATRLYEFLTGPVGALPGVDRVESAPHIRSVKQVGPVDGGA